MNWVGLFTLVERETKRFTSVWGQTVLAPIFSTGVFLVVFFLIFLENDNISNREKVFSIAPEAIMMSVIQNSFANSSFSLAFISLLFAINWILLFRGVSLKS